MSNPVTHAIYSNYWKLTLVLDLTFQSAPEGSRTPNLLIRSQMLYPIKLRVQ